MQKTAKFNIYTAIDIMDGKCVRLFKGDFTQSETYNDDPASVALDWQNRGAQYLHVIDLDGARYGENKSNLELIKRLISSVNVPVQLGGGIRNLQRIASLLALGLDRVILGSSIVKDPNMVKQALQEFGGNKIVLGIDCKNGYLAIEGWLESSQYKAVDIVKDFQQHGLEIIHFTDIDRDGTLAGPNIPALEEFLTEAPISTISSGGISCIEDVQKLKALQKQSLTIDGVIIGKALYTGKINPQELYTDSIYY